MNVRFCIFYVSLIVLSGIYAADTREARELYYNGEYAQALERYKEISSPTREDYYAMGACCYHLGDDAQTIAYWKKAERGASSQLLEAIDSGMERLYARAGKHYKVSWYAAITRRLMCIPMLFFQLFILCGFVILVASRSSFKRRKKIGIALRMLMILSVIGLYQLDEQSRGTSKSAAIVRAGPSYDYPVVSELSLFDEVAIEDKNDTWYKIKHSKTKGWVEKGKIASA